MSSTFASASVSDSGDVTIRELLHLTIMLIMIKTLYCFIHISHEFLWTTQFLLWLVVLCINVIIEFTVA